MRIARSLFLSIVFVFVAEAQTLVKYLDLGPQPTPCCIVTDSAGNAYIAASLVTSVSAQGVLAKVVVMKVDPTNKIVYRFVFGGSGYDSPSALAMDANANLIVVGSTLSPDFPLAHPLLTNAPSRSGRGFISKINPTGTGLLFSTLLGGLASDSDTVATAVALDASGSIYVTGGTAASDFPLTSNAYRRTGSSFIVKLTNTGDRILYSSYLGPASAGTAISVANDGTMTVAGTVSTDAFPVTPGAFQTSCKCPAGSPLEGTTSHSTSFISRLSADGGSLEWSTFLGGSGGPGAGLSEDSIEAIALTSDGGVVVAGIAESPDFPVTPNAFQTQLHANTQGFGVPKNLFVSRLNATGTALLDFPRRLST